jgi:hypothetical protein
MTPVAAGKLNGRTWFIDGEVNADGERMVSGCRKMDKGSSEDKGGLGV